MPRLAADRPSLWGDAAHAASASHNPGWHHRAGFVDGRAAFRAAPDQSLSRGAHRLVVVCGLPGDLRAGSRLGGRPSRSTSAPSNYALRRSHGIGNSRDDGRAPSGGRTEVTARLLVLADAGFLMSCTGLRAASRPSQARAGGAAPRFGDSTSLRCTARTAPACHGAQGMNGPSYPLANPAISGAGR